MDYYEAKETYSRIGPLRSYENLQSYWTTTKLRKLTVVLDYYEAIETYSRIGLPRGYGNLQSYWTTTKLWKLTVVLYHCLYTGAAGAARVIHTGGADDWEVRIEPEGADDYTKKYTRNEWKRL